MSRPTGFDWIEGDVEKITPRDENLKVPHMGWNTLDVLRDHPVLERLAARRRRAATPISCTPITSTRRTTPTCSRAPTMAGRSRRSSAKDTAFGTQFHPEKSQRLGLALISNFLKWKP